MHEAEQEELRRRLLQYPGATDENVDLQIGLYEQREAAKQELIDRGFSNAMAESHLNRQGYSRPPGWHSVFFYPGSNRPRNTVIFWLVVILGVLWFFVD